MSTNTEMQLRWNAVMQGNYSTPAIALDHGRGAEVWDVEGNKYIDLLAGIATNLLGHAHPAIVDAVTEQVSKLGHVSNLFMHEPGLALAEKLGSLVNGGRVFFCNSGAEANEAAFKLSRLTGRTEVISTLGAFHGRTMGALALTGQPSKADAFAPLPGGVIHVPYGDITAMRTAISERTAMVIVEPIQGEAGVVVPPPGYLAEIRELTSATGALFAVDEVQTGMGRTGTWFAHEREGISPDVITMAKGLGAGLPLGAMIARGPAAELLTAGSHGSTFGGNPLSTAAGLAAISVIEHQGLLAQVASLGDRLVEIVMALGDERIIEVRGHGLLRGIVFSEPIAKSLNASLARSGVLANAPADNVLRLAPPLTITSDQLDEFASILQVCLSEVTA